MRYDDLSIPLGVRIVCDRFVKILTKQAKEFFTDKGIIVDGIKLSYQSKVPNSTTIKSLLYALKSKDTNYNSYQITSYNNTKDESTITTVLDKIDVPMFVFANSDFTRIVPGIIAAGEDGLSYFVYNLKASSVSTPLGEDLDGFRAFPVSKQIAVMAINNKDYQEDLLLNALSTVSKYKLYNVNYEVDDTAFKYKEYMKNILETFNFETNVFDLLTEGKYNYIPLVKFNIDGNGMEITDAIVSNNERKIVLGDYDNNDLIVLSSSDRVLYSNASNILQVSGEYCVIGSKKDMVGKGESDRRIIDIMTVTAGKKLPNVDKLGMFNYRLDNSVRTMPFAAKEEYVRLNVDKKNKLTEQGKKENEYHMINMIKSFVFDPENLNINGLGESFTIIDRLYKDIDSFDKKTLTSTLNIAVQEAFKKLYDDKNHEAIIFLGEIKKHILNKGV